MEIPENLYRTQVRQLKDYAMYFIDPDGVIKTWNAGVEQLFGYSEAEWIGQHTAVIFTPADKAMALCESEMRIAREQGGSTDIRWHRRKDGTEFFANGVMSPVLDAAGNLAGYTKIASDETARKKLEDSLLAANTALEHFAYAASHDLKEPLRTIGSYAQLLVRRNNDQLSDAGKEYLAFISSAVVRMNGLIEDLLAYARAGIEKESVDAASLDQDFEAALTQLTGAVEEAGAMVTHAPLPTVMAEHTQMTRLFLNLIGNAIKYRAAGRQAKIHVESRPEGPEWIISVADNGIGFAQEYAEKIFNPFTRLHGQEYSGSGVGLTICRRIVEHYGGRIWAESKVGEGSTFHFTLPRQE